MIDDFVIVLLEDESWYWLGSVVFGWLVIIFVDEFGIF